MYDLETDARQIKSAVNDLIKYDENCYSLNDVKAILNASIAVTLLREAEGKISRYERKKDDAANVYAGLFRDYTTLQELFIAKEEEYKERIKELETMNEWQDIESAPKDKTAIIGLDEDNELVIVELDERGFAETVILADINNDYPKLKAWKPLPTPPKQKD